MQIQIYCSINPATGELVFVAAPDFEIPTDANLDNIYEVMIQVSVGRLQNLQILQPKSGDFGLRD